MSPARLSPTTRWVTRRPAASVTLTTSPTASAVAGTVRARARDPVGISGPIEPDRKTSGRRSSTAPASTTSTQSTPATAPSVSALSRAAAVSRRDGGAGAGRTTAAQVLVALKVKV